ncbi:MAG: HPr family phosphocarrier protein [Gammaproteobacteria bacterium]|nr:HPr family phosphocarrier protein [Gammaproteobacteria bacterium]
MPSRECTIVNPKGLHARAAAEVVKLVGQFKADITIEHQGKKVSADSLIHLLTLAANCGKTISVSTRGEDADAALEALTNLIEQGFYET